MNVNLLAISIGNTRIHLGLFVDGNLTTTHALDHEPLATLGDLALEHWQQISERSDAQIVLASVNPKITDRAMVMLELKLGKRPLRVEEDLNVPIGRQLDRETLVGEDRLLNAAAGYDRLKQALVIVDAGTAITIDFVDGAGTFHGGAIAPGASLMLRAMHEHTAQLPTIELAAPEEAIGHNTGQAMLSGVYYGLRGMVRELTEKFAETAGNYPMVIATGGDAELLFKDYDLIDRVVPELTLLGIAVTLHASMKSEE